MKKEKLLRREGFWYSKTEHLLPKPAHNINFWKGRRQFLKRLLVIQSKCKEEHMRGWSTCRLCKIHNGTTQFYYRGWTWPSGYYHYVKDHGVRPSLAFQECILGHYVR